jgi:pyroglutamyl-peptidase
MNSSTILLTGFGPFPGVPQNPTADIAQSLHGHSIGSRLVQGKVLDVHYESIETQLQTAIDRLNPSACVLLGIAINRNLISLEKCAYNRAEAGRADAKGHQPEEDKALSNHHAIDTELQTSLLLAPMREALLAKGLPTEISRDPGRYLCNASYFHALLQARSTVDCLFVHLPMPGNPIGDRTHQKWTLSMLSSATNEVLRSL